MSRSENGRRKTILVITGAGGFMGWHASNFGAEHYPYVVTADVAPVDRSLFKGSGCRLVEVKVDLTRPSDLRELYAVVSAIRAKDPDMRVVIWHMGGIFNYAAGRDLLMRINVQGTRDLVELVALPLGTALESFVFWSGLTVNGNFDYPERPTTEYSPTIPANAYGWSKLLAEHALHTYRAKNNLPVVILRLGGVYGPGGPITKRYGMSIPIQMLSKGRLKTPNIMIGSKPRRATLVHAEDVIRTADFVAHVPEAQGETYVVTDRHPYKLEEVNAYLGSLMGNPLITAVRLPAKLLRAALPLMRILHKRFGGAMDPGLVEMAFLDPYCSGEKLFALAEKYGRGVNSPDPLFKWPDSKDGFLQTVQEYQKEGFIKLKTDPACGAAAHRFLEILREPTISPERVAQFLDGLSHHERVYAVRSVKKRDQKALWNAVKGFGRLRLTDLVPSYMPALAPVHHLGKNTLPEISDLAIFEKRFARPADEDAENPGKLLGYNFQSLSPITGPGYFAARQGENGELLVDYILLPEAFLAGLPRGWPQVVPNSRGLSKLIYCNMVDTLRRVSEHVTIGWAAKVTTKGLKDMGAYFMLCREDES